MVINKVILNASNNTITLDCNLSQSTQEGYETIEYIAIDDQNTFVCVNDPSEKALLCKIQQDSYIDPISLDSVPYININTDLLYIFITVANKKYYKYNSDSSSWELTSIIPEAKQSSLEDKPTWSLDTVYYTVEYTTKLVVTYDSASYTKYMWNILKTTPVKICCGEVPDYIKNILIYKEGVTLALQYKDFKKANIFWNKVHLNNNININNCTCNG
jgi:hypothetical protein